MAARTSDRASGYSPQAKLALVGMVALVLGRSSVLWDLSWHHTPDAGDFLGLPHPFILPHFVTLGALVVLMLLPLRLLMTLSNREATAGGRATLWIGGRARTFGAALALVSGVVGIIGLLWDGAVHIQFGRDDTHWTPSHLLLMGSAFPLVLGFVLLYADELEAERERGRSSGAMRWLQAGLILGFMLLVGGIDIVLSPWLQLRSPGMFVPLSAAGGLMWLVAATRVWGQPGAATLTALAFVLWRELLSVGLVLIAYDRPPHLGAVVLLGLLVDLVFLVVRGRAGHAWVGAVAGLVASAVYALPAYALAFEALSTRDFGLGVVPPQQLVLVVGLTVALGTAGGLIGHWFGSLILGQRKLAERLAPPIPAAVERPRAAH